MRAPRTALSFACRTRSFQFTRVNSIRRVDVVPKATSIATFIRNSSSGIGRVKATPWSKVTSGASQGDGKMAKSADAKKHIAYIALGSNLGDRVAMIEQACHEMSARGIKVKRTSSLWETEPMYVLDQDSFLNGACEVRFQDSIAVTC